MKLAVVSTHPIQYQAPWFEYLAKTIDLRVFYLWDFGVTEKVDRGFGRSIQWDIPLLSGYEYEFVPNISRDPGTHHFRGLQNPDLKKRVSAYDPSAVLLTGYNYESFFRFLWAWEGQRAPLLFRGDSHRLVLPNTLREYVRRRFIEHVFKRFTAFLYVGKANQGYYEYHGVSSQKLFFAPHAVNNDYFMAASTEAKSLASKWRIELGIPQDHAVIMFAGKFEADKRPLDLLNAFVRARLKRATLLFVGAGSFEENLRALAARYSRIIIAPFQNQSLMPRTYATADLLVLPSASETWGLSINEAMCLGRPVIVSDRVGCAQDLVVTRKNGLVFAAGDVGALTACLEDALGDRARLQEWGEASRDIVSRYSYRETTQGLNAALAHACAASR